MPNMNPSLPRQRGVYCITYDERLSVNRWGDVKMFPTAHFAMMELRKVLRGKPVAEKLRYAIVEMEPRREIFRPQEYMVTNRYDSRYPTKETSGGDADGSDDE